MADSLLSFHLQKRFFLSMSILLVIVNHSTIPALSMNSSITNNNALKRQGLVLKLIHRDLIDPPTYPPNSTLVDRIDLALSRVAGRSSQANMNQTTSYSENAIGGMGTYGTSFFAMIQIGSPKVSQYVIFDTGSNVLWVKCTGNNPSGRHYVPTRSTSFQPSTCLAPGDRYCKKVRGGGCDSENRCKYAMEYMDGSYSKGFIGFETITFENVHGTQSQISNVLFGCGMSNKLKNTMNDGAFGLVGLLELSILDRTSKKFSFCFGRLDDRNYRFNHLALGDDAKLKGFNVPMTPQGRQNLVVMSGITFGTERISNHHLVTEIDSGATFSYINPNIQKIISAKVEKAVSNRMEKVKSKTHPNTLCYRAHTLIHDIPELILELSQYTIRLDVHSLFWKSTTEKYVYCLSIQPLPTSSGPNVIGATALQYYNVGFDLTNRRIYFDKVDDCKSVMEN